MKIYCIFGKHKVPVDLEPVGDKLYLAFPFHRPMIDEVKCMSGAEWHPDVKKWSVLINKRNVFTFELLQNKGEILRYDKPIEEINREGYFKHQNHMYSFAKVRQRAIVAGEMRVGKTRPILDLIGDLQKEESFLTWLVSTKSALRGISRELVKWGFKYDIELLTYSGLRSKLDIMDRINIPKFLVFDECQKIKTPTSMTTEAAMLVSDLMYRKYNGEEYIIGLSGTPSPKDPTDWWSTCEVICPGFIKESTKHKLETRLANCEMVEYAPGRIAWRKKKTKEYPDGWKHDEIEKLYKRLSGLVSVYFKKDCLDLPDKVYELAIMKPKKAILNLAKFIVANEEHKIASITKLMQLSDGFQYEYEYIEKSNTKRRLGAKWLDNSKLVRLTDDLNEHEDVGRLVIYAGFEASVEAICKQCLGLDWTVMRIDGRGTYVFKSKSDNLAIAAGDLFETDFTEESLLNEMDRSTNTGKINKLVLVAQADSAGTGLELSATPTIIYYSNTNKGESRMQSEDRAHSINMDKSRGLTIIDYIHLSTDQKVRDSLLQKKSLQAISMGELEEAFKTHLSEV